MFKKWLGLVVMVMVLMVSGVAFGYTTWQEAMDAGWTKYIADPRDFAGAKADFDAALLLGTTEEQKGAAQVKIGICLLGLKQYTEAEIAFKKVLVLANATDNDKSIAYQHIVSSYIERADYATAIVNAEKGLSFISITPIEKSALQNSIAFCYNKQANYDQAAVAAAKILFADGVYPGHRIIADRLIRDIGHLVNWKSIITQLPLAVGWEGLLVKAKFFDNAKMITEALDSCDIAFDLLKGKEDIDAIAAKRKILTLREDIAWRAKNKSYGDIVSP